MPAALKMSENDLQVQVAQALHYALPPDAWFTSIDHATKSEAEWQKKARRGVKAGVPDLVVLCRGKCVWIELKVGSNRPSDMQKLVAGQILCAGHEWFVCWSLDEVVDALVGAGIPLRRMRSVV